MKGAAIAGILPGAAAAASAQLLGRVDALLGDAGAIQQRLVGVGGPGGGTLLAPSAAEDDGICIDDARQQEGSELEGLLLPAGQLAPTAATSEGGVQQQQQGTAAADRQGAAAGLAGVLGGAAGAAAEVVDGLEVWYEHQTRDASNTWVPHTPAGSSSSRDQVHPPAGWEWAGEWVLQQAGAGEAAGEVAAGLAGLLLDDGSSSSRSGAGSGGDGWRYSDQPPGVSQQWGDACTDSSRWRRRQWQRRRRRLHCTGGPGVTALPHAAVASGQQVAAGGGGAAAAGCHDEGMVLLAVLLCTLLRGSKLQESKRAAMLLLTAAALGCEDDVRLQTVVPYLLTQLADPHAAVRCVCVPGLVGGASMTPCGATLGWPACQADTHTCCLACLLDTHVVHVCACA